MEACMQCPEAVLGRLGEKEHMLAGGKRQEEGYGGTGIPPMKSFLPSAGSSPPVQRDKSSLSPLPSHGAGGGIRSPRSQQDPPPSLRVRVIAIMMVRGARRAMRSPEV